MIVVEASAGYGKSVLASELIDRSGAVGISVQLEHAAVSAGLLAARLRAAVARAGYTDAAAAASETGEDPVGAVGAILDALAAENCVFVIDDAHEALADAAALVDWMAHQLQGEQRLLVLARRLPDGAERLRRAENLQLSSVDLALTDDETLLLCRQGFGLDVDATAAHALEAATAGWTAATVLAAARAARTGEELSAVAETTLDPRHPSTAVAAILEQAVVALGTGARSQLAQIARLPLLSPAVVDAVADCPGFFDSAAIAGLPFTAAGDGWWTLPGPVCDFLACLAETDMAALGRAAQEYERRGEPGHAVRLLLVSGDHGQAAQLLARMSPDVTEDLGFFELQAIFNELPAAVVKAHPEVMVTMARNLRVATKFDQSHQMLEQALSAAVESGNATLEREVRAEFANELMTQLQSDAAALVARNVLAEASIDEGWTRARAYSALGMALCWRTDDSGRRDEAALVEAEDCFSRATQLYLALGGRSQASGMAPYWALKLELARGHTAAALRRLDQALALVTNRPRRWGYVMMFKTWVAAELGDDDLCRRCADDVLRLAKQLDSDLFHAQAHWKLAHLTSYRGDADNTLQHLREAEAFKGAWWGPASGDFLAEGADMLSRVGLASLAWEYLARVKAEPKDAAAMIALAEAALETRQGDPLLAELRIEEAARSAIEPREYWRLTLFKAYAALRRGDYDIAGPLAAQAFEEAARLGQEGLPLLRERAITEELLGLAVETGQPATLALQASAQPVTVALLGRFELARAGQTVPLRSAQETQLLKLVAIRGGRVHADQAIDTLWPDVEPDSGRNRLRTVLNRLRTAAGPVISRDGDVLVLDPSARVDLTELLAEAERARSMAGADPARGAALARGALARYRGELLPDDVYEQWTEAPRQRARAVAIDLLRLCADEATARGDLDAVRRLVERGIELAPYDDLLYTQAASALLEQGRRGEALSIVHRARSAFAQIGLEPPPALLEVEEAVAV